MTHTSLPRRWTRKRAPSDSIRSQLRERAAPLAEIRCSARFPSGNGYLILERESTTRPPPSSARYDRKGPTQEFGVMQAPPAGFSLAEVVVRLVRPTDQMGRALDQHHYLFCRARAALCGRMAWPLDSAGRLAGGSPQVCGVDWMDGGCAPSIANNTRFLDATRRAERDRRLMAGVPVEDPAGSGGELERPMPRLARMCLRSDACDILRQRGELADCWHASAGASSLEELQKLPDHRREHGRCTPMRRVRAGVTGGGRNAHHRMTANRPFTGS